MSTYLEVSMPSGTWLVFGCFENNSVFLLNSHCFFLTRDSLLPLTFIIDTFYSSHQKLNKIYEEIVQWKPIFLYFFKNKTGELFLKCQETTLQPLEKNTNHHEMSMKSAMVLPRLIPARTIDRPDLSVNKLLQKQLQLWINGDLDKLEESHALQKRIRTKRKLPFDETKEFNRQMNSGKVPKAIRTLQNEQNSGVFDLREKINGETVLQILKSKHPIDLSLIVDEWLITLPYHTSTFDRIDAHAIRRATLKTSGGHGTSGVDALEWGQYLTAFGSRSESFCRRVAKKAVRLATE